MRGPTSQMVGEELGKAVPSCMLELRDALDGVLPPALPAPAAVAESP